MLMSIFVVLRVVIYARAVAALLFMRACGAVALRSPDVELESCQTCQPVRASLVYLSLGFRRATEKAKRCCLMQMRPGSRENYDQIASALIR